MSMKILSGYVGTLFAISLFCCSSPAYAGFQWAPVQTPPDQAPLAQAPISSAPVSSASVSTTPVSPAPVSSPSVSPMPALQAPLPAVTTTVTTTAPTIISTSSSNAPTSSSAVGSSAVETSSTTFTPMATDNPEVVAPVIIGDTPASTITTTTISTSGYAPSMPPSHVDSTFQPQAPADSAGPLSPGPLPDMPPLSPSAPTRAMVPLAPPDNSMPPSPPMPDLVDTSSTHDSEIVKGFAKHVPLSVALRQVLPSAYSFSIDQDVDIGVMISFKGGKPWPQTLSDMLMPVGLTSHVDGQMVVISRIEATSPVAPLATKELPAIRSPAPGYMHVNESVPAATDLTTTYNPAVPSANAPVMNSSEVLPTAAATNLPPLSPTTASMPTVPMAETIATSSLSAPSEDQKVASSQIWVAERGDSLRKILTEWSKRNHVEVEWLAEYDYPLQASINFNGSYEDAVRNLLSGFEGAHPQPYAQLHANSGLGQMVLVVHARGNTNKD